MKLNLPITFRSGLGYSPASGPQVGGIGLGINGDPSIYSSTFFGSDVKGLFPNRFSSKRRRTIKKNKRSKSILKNKKKRLIRSISRRSISRSQKNKKRLVKKNKK